MTAKRAGRGKPLVSVIVPVFNGAATLERTLRSIGGQTYADLEILIVDDGSTDASADIAARFCASDSRARLLRQPNRGVASARNAGLREAAGGYCAPIDADDLWHPAKIERQMAAMLAASEPPAFVYCWFRHIDGRDRVWQDGPRPVERGPALQRLIYYNFVGNGSALLFPRVQALAAGGYDERLQVRGVQGCEDFLLQLQLARAGPVAVVPEYLVGYRHTPNSMSHDAVRMRRSWTEALRIFHRGGGRSMPRVARHGDGRRSLGDAETAALRRDYGRAAFLLYRSLRCYPSRTAFVLACRAARLLAKNRRREEAPDFLGIDPTSAVPIDRWLSSVQQFDERRLRELEAEDALAVGIDPDA